MAIDTLLSAAHLRRELGEERFAVLVSSDHTARVRALCDELLEAALPTEMTIGGVTYDILSFLRGEKSVKGDVMVARAKEMNAHNGKKERERLLAHQSDKSDIPVVLQERIAFVFTDDPRPGPPGRIAIVSWHGDRWVQFWRWLAYGWDGRYRVLRRKSK